MLLVVIRPFQFCPLAIDDDDDDDDDAGVVVNVVFVIL